MSLTENFLNKARFVNQVIFNRGLYMTAREKLEQASVGSINDLSNLLNDKDVVESYNKWGGKFCTGGGQGFEDISAPDLAISQLIKRYAEERPPEEMPALADLVANNNIAKQAITAPSMTKRSGAPAVAFMTMIERAGTQEDRNEIIKSLSKNNLIHHVANEASSCSSYISQYGEDLKQIIEKSGLKESTETNNKKIPAEKRLIDKSHGGGATYKDVKELLDDLPESLKDENQKEAVINIIQDAASKSDPEEMLPLAELCASKANVRDSAVDSKIDSNASQMAAAAMQMLNRAPGEQKNRVRSALELNNFINDVYKKSSNSSYEPSL